MILSCVTETPDTACGLERQGLFYFIEDGKSENDKVVIIISNFSGLNEYKLHKKLPQF